MQGAIPFDSEQRRSPGGPQRRPLGFEAGRMPMTNDPEAVATCVAKLAAALKQAVAAVGTPAFRRMQQACMAADVGWDAPAASWQALIEEVAGRERE